MQNKHRMIKAAAVILICLTVSVFCPALSFECAAETTAEWKNDETGYRAVIDDRADLLNDAEETLLLESMKEMTGYANIAVYTVSTSTSLKDYERARTERAELFGDTDSAVFMIDMYLRRIIIHRYGTVDNSFTNASANNITNNVSGYATDKEYYLCALNAVEQITDVMEGNSVPKPMMHWGIFCVSLALGVMLAYIVLVLTSTTYRKPVREVYLSHALKKKPVLFENVEYKYKKTTEKGTPPSKGGSGGSSCSSCGSSCSSCGSSCGGSSCGGSSF